MERNWRLDFFTAYSCPSRVTATAWPQRWSFIVGVSYDDDLDTGQIDLSELDASPTVAVQALVRAVNILLDREDVRERFVLLCCDGRRECYVRVSLADALALCTAGHLASDEDEAVLDLGAWGRS